MDKHITYGCLQLSADSFYNNDCYGSYNLDRHAAAGQGKRPANPICISFENAREYANGHQLYQTWARENESNTSIKCLVTHKNMINKYDH